MQALRGGGGIAPILSKPGTRTRCIISNMLQPLSLPKEPITIVQ